MENLDNNLFYNIEKAIFLYRNLSQRKLIYEGYLMTVDQWLALKTLQSNPELSQLDICKKIFKTPAFMHEMIEEMVEEKYITTQIDLFDPRILHLELTIRGEEALKSIDEHVVRNRAVALKNISPSEIEQTMLTLKKIIANCQNNIIP